MRFATTWLRFVARRKPYPLLSLQKSVALRFLEHRSAAPVPKVERLKVFVKLNLRLLLLPFRLQRRRGVKTLLLNIADNDRERRMYFATKYAGSDPATTVNYNPGGQDDVLFHDGLSLRRLMLLWRAGWLIWKGGLADLLGKGKVRPVWHLYAANLLLQQILFHGEGREVIFFFCYYPQTYLTALVAGVLLRDYHPIMVTSSGIQFENNRYHYNPAARCRYCSRVQAPEITHYERMGWMRFHDKALWGLEEVNMLDGLEQTQPTVDIGIFCSGFWARTERGWTIADLDGLRRYAYNDHRWYQVFLGILETVIAVKQAQPHVTAKVYLHPFERRLWRENGIAPPYLDRLEEAGILYEYDGPNSLSQFYESRIGVSTQSTIVFDRMHYGLDSLFYAGKEAWQPIAPQYLGEFQQFGFKDFKELRNKLCKLLGVDE